MKRKVIFTPDDYWTNPPRKNMNISPRKAGDLRRAGVLIKHRIAGDTDGINTILTEALEAARATELVDAVLITLGTVATRLLTPEGLAALDEWVAFYADRNWDHVPDQWHPAARFITAHGLKDYDTMTAILNETSDDVAPTILATIDVYINVMPVLHTHIGTRVLSNGISKLAGIEAEAD